MNYVIDNMNAAAHANGNNNTTSAQAVVDGSLPMRKRKDVSGPVEGEDPKKFKVMHAESESDIAILARANAASLVDDDAHSDDADLDPITHAPMTKAREVRLEQNRKAARESRRRKKIMIEELQRSVVFFSRANGTLKQQNDELQRMLIQAQARITAFEKGDSSGFPLGLANGQDALKDDLANKEARDTQAQQAVASAQAQAAQAAATQAMFQNQGFPPAAARQAAQTFVAGPSPTDNHANNDQMQVSQDSWQNSANAAAPNSMQNMQSILFAVQNGMQQITNPMFQNGFMPMQQNVADSSQESMNAQQGQHAANDVLS
jgi:hypothetical protein|eukprot:scaffold3920_cov239-Chaetoceros_neogracile.AAC.5